MPEFPLLIGFVVLIIVTITLALMAVFRLADTFIFCAQLAFVVATVAAVWGAFSGSPNTEYAVWSMYGTGILLAGLMIWRSMSQIGARPKFSKSELSD